MHSNDVMEREGLLVLFDKEGDIIYREEFRQLPNVRLSEDGKLVIVKFSGKNIEDL